jgi:uncharacterized membrane protein YagU involved in acid resistance
MTPEQIIWQIGIGLFLLVLGAVLGPLFKSSWAWMNRPTPLSPKDKGKLLEQITIREQALERMNYFSTHSKDLFLYLYQVSIVALLLFVVAMCVYAFIPLPRVEAFLLFIFLVALSVVFCIMGFVEASRMSDKKIDAYKETIKKSIDEAKRRLNTPL